MRLLGPDRALACPGSDAAPAGTTQPLCARRGGVSCGAAPTPLVPVGAPPSLPHRTPTTI